MAVHTQAFVDWCESLLLFPVSRLECTPGQAAHFHKVLLAQQCLKGSASQAHQIDVIIRKAHSLRVLDQQAHSSFFSNLSQTQKTLDIY